MLLEVLQYATGVFQVVYDGQHAVKFTLGKAKKVVGPGVHFKVPLFQTYRVEETKDTTLALETQRVQLQDDLVYQVKANLVYQIVNLHNAMIEVDQLQHGLRNRMVMAVQAVIASKNRETVRDHETVVKEIRAILEEVEEAWGIRIERFGFTDFAATTASLEVVQLRLLADEKKTLFGEFRKAGLSDQVAVALISGAVVTVGPEPSS